MRWEDDGYARRDDDGQPVSLVSFFSHLARPWDSLLREQEEYERRASTKKTWWNLTIDDIKMYAITGYETPTASTE